MTVGFLFLTKRAHTPVRDLDEKYKELADNLEEDSDGLRPFATIWPGDDGIISLEKRASEIEDGIVTAKAELNKLQEEPSPESFSGTGCVVERLFPKWREERRPLYDVYLNAVREIKKEYGEIMAKIDEEFISTIDDKKLKCFYADFVLKGRGNGSGVFGVDFLEMFQDVCKKREPASMQGLLACYNGLFPEPLVEMTNGVCLDPEWIRQQDARREGKERREWERRYEEDKRRKEAAYYARANCSYCKNRIGCRMSDHLEGPCPSFVSRNQR